MQKCSGVTCEKVSKCAEHASVSMSHPIYLCCELFGRSHEIAEIHPGPRCVRCLKLEISSSLHTAAGRCTEHGRSSLLVYIHWSLAVFTRPPARLLSGAATNIVNLRQLGRRPECLPHLSKLWADINTVQVLHSGETCGGIAWNTVCGGAWGRDSINVWEPTCR